MVQKRSIGMYAGVYSQGFKKSPGRVTLKHHNPMHPVQYAV